MFGKPQDVFNVKKNVAQKGLKIAALGLLRLHNTLAWRSAGIHTYARTLIAHKHTPRVRTWSLVTHAEVMHIHVPPTRHWLSQETHIGSDCWPGSVAAKALFQTYAKAPFQTFSRYFNAGSVHLANRPGWANW